MNENIIKIEGISKFYKLGELHKQTDSFRDTLTRSLKKILHIKKNYLGSIRDPESAANYKDHIWALKDISFKVNKGEVLGIIGHNGAGKSTLLKILSRIIKPSRGEGIVNGRTGSLLEVGTGFHPELTGRENIFLNGSIIGMKRSEIKNQYDKIVKFAEVENFLDTPIKRYSSGMLVRLGFSVASHIDVDLLIIDEVLAVGDLAFQRKCFNRIESLIKNNNTTILFVSHNIRQVERICSRVILLDQGRILADGEPKEVCNLFFKLNNKKIQSYNNELNRFNSNVHSSGEIEVKKIDILDSNDNPTDEIETCGPLKVLIRLQLERPIKKPEIVVGTHTTDLIYLSASSTSVFDERPDFESGIHEVSCIIPSFPMVAGTYCIRIAIFDQDRRLLFSGETLKIFSVVSKDDETTEPGLRSINIPTIWELEGKSYSKLNKLP